VKVAVGFDHGGFNLKNNICELIKASGHEVVDMGAYSMDPNDDYPDFAIKVAMEVSHSNVTKGIVVCGSGVGASIAANKIKGVRASVCHDLYSAQQGVEHDDMNVLCLGGRIIDESTASELVIVFLNADFFGEERHLRRLNKINKIDSR